MGGKGLGTCIVYHATHDSQVSSQSFSCRQGRKRHRKVLRDNIQGITVRIDTSIKSGVAFTYAGIAFTTPVSAFSEKAATNGQAFQDD